MWRCAVLVSRRRLYSTRSGFADLGIDTKLIQALETRFQVHTPSSMQEELIRQTTTATNNLLVRQHTGSGKTFALILSLLSLTIRDHHLLRGLGLDESSALSVQQANSVVVVPNRELAFQIESWVSRLMADAYPEIPRQKIIGRYVSGVPYEAQQRGVLKRHGVPAIVVGTPRCLLELAYPEDGTPLIGVRAPDLLVDIVEQSEQLKGEFKLGAAKPGVGSYRGVRRLVLDEVDGMLRLPNRHATERQKLLRREKPKPGQIFVDRLLGTLGVTRISNSLRPPQAFARSSNAKGWQKASDLALARKSLAAETKKRPEVNIVNEHSLQIIAVSATANKDLRNWMVHRGWMTMRPLMIDNPGQNIDVPTATTHHCLVIENDRAIRNLRDKSESPQESSRTEADTLQKEEEGDRSDSEQQTMMEQMSEVAANVIRELEPRGSVIIFTRSDASTAQFGRVLESYGVVARDIMTRFDEQLGTMIDQSEGKEFLDIQAKYAPNKDKPLGVFLATEEAARGLDLPDASLVLILDIPKSVASYAHLSGRTGRFGQPGTVVTVVPVGRLGWFESKMRGIFAALNIRPTKAEFIQD
ncbi:hypothetical protein GGH13_000628 [Coemansia sp. S155-1]|nr:hypothetical protein GGH13_000628 [Coemansia sp. S155-1]